MLEHRVLESGGRVENACVRLAVEGTKRHDTNSSGSMITLGSAIKNALRAGGDSERIGARVKLLGAGLARSRLSRSAAGATPDFESNQTTYQLMSVAKSKIINVDCRGYQDTSWRQVAGEGNAITHSPSSASFRSVQVGP